MVEITNWNEVIAVLVALISFLIAWWQNRQKNAIVDFYTVPVNNSPVVNIIPEKSFLMSDETKKWITAGEDESAKMSILAQIAKAEADRCITYSINYDKGGYIIEYGLIKSSWRGK